MLVVSNHTSYWDPMIAMVLAHAVPFADGYAMMDAANLRARPFLGRMGGFGVDLADRRDGARAVSYAANLLDRPGRLVWVFPQGEERPATSDLGDFKPGAAIIARRAPGASVVPVGLHYAFGSTEWPDAYIAVGPPLSRGVCARADARAQRAAVVTELDRITGYIETAAPSKLFEVICRKRRAAGMGRAERMLSWLTRY